MTTMIKDTTKSSNGTIFQGDTIRTSYNILEIVLGKPEAYESGKVAFEWTKEIEGEVFTVYDWKEQVFFHDDLIDWHIGATTPETSKKAKEELEKLVLKVK